MSHYHPKVSLSLSLSLSLYIYIYTRQEDNAHEYLGIKTEKECADNAQQQLQSTDLTSHERGCPTSTNP
jgi:hypothetical protein